MYNVAMKLKTFTVLFVFLIVTIILLADSGHLGFLGFVYRFPYGDKAGHFILYGILSFLLNLVSLRSAWNRKPITVVFIVSLLLALAIGLEEWAQQFFPLRTSDWMDLFFSYIGVALGAWIAYRNGKPPVK